MKKNRIMENIYDLIKETALPDNQNDEWAELSRKHKEEARKELGKFLRHKSIEWDNNTIKIGRDIKIIIA